MLVVPRGLGERGVVGEAEVAAKPDDGGTHRRSIHATREMRIALDLRSVDMLRLVSLTATSHPVVPKEILP